MTQACEIVVYIRSEKVTVGAWPITILTWTGLTPTSAWPVVRKEIVRLVERRVSEEQRRVVEEARRLAASSRSRFRLVDLGTGNTVLRFLSRVILRPRAFPVLIVRGPCPWIRSLPARGHDLQRWEPLTERASPRTA